MNEVAEDAPRQQQASAGALLRAAREASGLHVAALAVSLKVPVRKLEALEEDRYADLGDAVFIRGLASSVCRTLKIDPQPVLAQLPQTSAPRLIKDSDGINAPFRAPGDGPAPSWIDRFRQPVPATVTALLVAAVVIYFLPASRHETAKSEVQPSAARSAPAAPADAAASAQEVAFPSAAVASGPATAASAISPAPPPAATLAPASATAPTAASSQPVAAPAQAAPATAAPASSLTQVTGLPAATSGIVAIRTRGESWVEVVDSSGAVVLRKLMTGGETAGAGGALPLTVTVGKVDVTEVEVRGRKFDMRPVSKDNVARFTVK